MANTTIYNTTNNLDAILGQIAVNDPYQQMSLGARFNLVLTGYSDTNKYVAQDYSSGGRLVHGVTAGGQYRVTMDNYELTYTGTFNNSFSRVSEISAKHIFDGSTVTLKGNITYNGLPFFTAENLSSTISSLRAATADFIVELKMTASLNSAFDILGNIQSVNSAILSADYRSGKVSTFYTEALGGNLQFKVAGLYSDSVNSRITGGYLDSFSIGLYDGKTGVFTDSILSTGVDISVTKAISDAINTSSNDVITLTGTLGSFADAGGGNDTVYGSRGNDSVRLGGGNDTLDGGSGIDTAVYAGLRTNFTVTKTTNGYTVAARTGTDGTDTLTNVERLQFSDANVAFDIDANAGQVYRLYQAAFNRTPDLAGLGGWIAAMDNGSPLLQIASSFMASAEFQSLYSANPTNTQFVSYLYTNALHRPAGQDAASAAGWVNQLSTNQISRAQALVSFSESSENKASVLPAIAKGITYATAEQATGLANGKSFTGTANAETMIGSVGKDTFTPGAGNDTIDGGDAIDTVVFSGIRSSYTITRSGTGNDTVLTVSGGVDGTDTLSQIERLKFNDGVLAFDTSGNAGQTYRLYQAALNRTPDKGGLTEWVHGMDSGLTLTQVANGFIGSAEFKGLYGANPSNTDFINLLYSNVLRRAADQVGADYWNNQLGSGVSKEQVLIGFSESAENQAALIGVIQNGIALGL